MRGGPLGRTFPCLHITPNKWKNKAESSHADSLTTGQLYTSTVIFLPTIIWWVHLPSSPKQADPITHKGICPLISCPFHPEQVLTSAHKFLTINSNVPFPVWILMVSHSKYLCFFCNHHLAFSQPISIQTVARQLYRFHSCQLRACSLSLVTAAVLHCLWGDAEWWFGREQDETQCCS